LDALNGVFSLTPSWPFCHFYVLFSSEIKYYSRVKFFHCNCTGIFKFSLCLFHTGRSTYGSSNSYYNVELNERKTCSGTVFLFWKFLQQYPGRSLMCCSWYCRVVFIKGKSLHNLLLFSSPWLFLRYVPMVLNFYMINWWPIVAILWGTNYELIYI
jgi:hypothetical protein